MGILAIAIYRALKWKLKYIKTPYLASLFYSWYVISISVFSARFWRVLVIERATAEQVTMNHAPVYCGLVAIDRVVDHKK